MSSFPLTPQKGTYLLSVPSYVFSLPENILNASRKYLPACFCKYKWFFCFLFFNRPLPFFHSPPESSRELSSLSFLCTSVVSQSLLLPSLLELARLPSSLNFKVQLFSVTTFVYLRPFYSVMNRSFYL